LGSWAKACFDKTIGGLLMKTYILGIPEFYADGNYKFISKKKAFKPLE